MKKYLFTTLALSALLSFSGCGGGSSSSNSDSNSTKSNTTNTSSESSTSGSATKNTGSSATTDTSKTTDTSSVNYATKGFSTDNLKGKTFYELHDKGGKWISMSFAFANDGSTLTLGEYTRALSTTSYSINTTISGCKNGCVKFAYNGTTNYMKPLSQDNDKITLMITDKTSELSATTPNDEQFFFFDKAKASSYALSNLPTENGYPYFTTEYLNGKTLYSANFENNVNKWIVGKLVFTATTVSYEAILNYKEKSPVSAYTVTPKGYISVDFGYEDGTQLIKAISMDSKKMNILWEDVKWKDSMLHKTEPNKYFYFSKDDAISFVNSKNK